MAGLEQQPQAVPTQPVANDAAATVRLFPEAVALLPTSLPTPRQVASAEARHGGRRRRRGRRRRKHPPQSKHTLGVCLQFVTYQKEVLGHDNIWNATGLARYLHLSGKQDEEIDAYLTERASDAA